MKPILERRAAKYVEGGFRVCYLCGYNTPDEIHHKSYFPEECVALCHSCHGHVHSDTYEGSLAPSIARPSDYEKTRRQQEKEGDGIGWWSADNPVWDEVDRVKNR